MDEVEKYEFDRQGYLVIRNILTDGQVATLAAAVDALEEHALALVGRPPRTVTVVRERAIRNIATDSARGASIA